MVQQGGHARHLLTGRFTANASLHSTLRAMGVLGDKHIPDVYLQASVGQRQALLEGLMDTDGYIDRCGRCELTTVRRHLADQYRELVASPGFKPVISVKTATLNGKAVAGIGPQMNPGPPYWTTYVTVNSTDDVTAEAKDSGGKVIVEPMDVMDVGRMAIFADPVGAVISTWEPKAHIGAHIVNEPNSYSWSELVNCNVHLRGVAESVKRGVLQAGGLHVQAEVAGVPRVLPSRACRTDDLKMVAVTLHVVKQERGQDE
jgi:hypothetical protein